MPGISSNGLLDQVPDGYNKVLAVKVADVVLDVALSLAEVVSAPQWQWHTPSWSSSTLCFVMALVTVRADRILVSR